jgi:hypothetical protein
VFAHKRSAGIAVVLYDNGCRHVCGGRRITLDVDVDPAGIDRPDLRGWRADARALASATVDIGGGIAWDDRGTISLIVPRGVLVRVLPFWIALAKRRGIPVTTLLDFVIHGIADVAGACHLAPRGYVDDDDDPVLDIDDLIYDDDLVDGHRAWIWGGHHWTTPADWSVIVDG